ncbi:MAG: META domain-containing protein [Synergistaceae bacterium]|jgi:heat shock protein HslJ/membrane-bound inhibitor of C-type lysozyme|nr:META domain-containing protein [Synergistaceae bacterium]
MRKKFSKLGSPGFIVLLLTLLGVVAGASGAETASGDEVVTELDGVTYVMMRTPSASGEKYEAPDDPTTFFRSRGAEATLTIAGQEYSRYALLRKTPDDELILTVDGRNYRLRSAVSASGAKYEAADDPGTVLWNKGNTDTIYLAGKEYAEYDEGLPFGEIRLMERSLPVGTEWKVKTVSGIDVAAGSTITLTFHPDGRLSGLASINNYTASWLTSDDRIIISPGVSTKKAGPAALMEQEREFLALLPAATRFRVHGNTLTLVTGDEKSIVLKR